MASTYYAWSPIATDVDEKSRMQYIKLGDKVSAGDLDLSDDEFQELIDARVVREQPYPEELVNSPQPPSDYFKELLAGAAEGTLTEDQTKALAALSLGFDDSSSSKVAPGVSEGVEDVSGTTGSAKPAAAKAT